jgi:hypothetical protein
MSESRFAGQYRAVSFNYGGLGVDGPQALVVAAGPGTTGSETLTVYAGTIALSDGTIVSPLATTAPINIANAAGVDTVTPSAVSNNVQSNIYGPTATVTGTFTYAHYAGDRISSGTVGLQEAINYANSKGGGTVIVDNSWVTQGGTSAMIAAATLPAGGIVQILDNRGGAGSVSQTLTVAVPNASVLTLQSVGVPLISAPGAGNLIVVDHLVVEQVALTAAFAGTPGVITAAYGTQASQVAATGSIAATVLTGGSGTTNQIGFAEGIAPAVGNSSVYLNSAVGLYCATNNPTTGGGSLIVKITFHTLTGF